MKARWLTCFGFLFYLPFGFGQITIVSYANIPLRPGFSLVSNPLKSTDNWIVALFGTLNDSLPDGATIYLLKPTGYISTRFDAVSRQWFPEDVADEEILPGKGFIFHNPTHRQFTITFTGEILQGSLTNHLPAG